MKIKHLKNHNLKKQIKINFKHKKLNYKKWFVRLVVDFWSYIFKNRYIIIFKNKKLNYFRIFQKSNKIKNYQKSNQTSKSIIQKIVIESTINNKYQNHVLKIEKI